MGQYLATGIVTNYKIPKSNLTNFKISIKELIELMKNKIHFNENIYDLIETNQSFEFYLNSSIFESQLIPFLQKFYFDFYRNESNYSSCLEKLLKTDSKKYFELAQQKMFEVYQFDKYGEQLNLSFDSLPFQPSVSIKYETILLSMEGKIYMEYNGNHFNFFKLCLIEKYKEFLLANAIQMYITG